MFDRLDNKLGDIKEEITVINSKVNRLEVQQSQPQKQRRVRGSNE